MWFTWFAEILDDSKYGIVDRELRQTVLACLGKRPTPSLLLSKFAHLVAMRNDP